MQTYPTCPIAYWQTHHPNACVIDQLSYQNLEIRIQEISGALQHIADPLLAFSPKSSSDDIAFIFASWRQGKGLYPISPRLPQSAKQKRLALAQAKWVDPSTLSKVKRFKSATLSGALYIETSGTTSEPKIACLPIEAICIGAKSAVQTLSLDPNSKYALNLPLHHISGIATILRTFHAGATLLLDNLDLATHISMVPTQLYRLLEKKKSFPHLQALLLGGAPLSPTLFQQALEHALPLFTTYGMTETAAMATCRPPQVKELHAGKPLDHIEFMLSEEGEILVRGPSLFSHYLRQPPRNPLDWFPTRDIGTFDGAGNLTILGRKDRQFISGGENIQPEEIERALLTIPEILTAQIIPQKNLEFGMIPTAIITTCAPVNLKEIKEKLELILPRFKVPKQIIIKK